MKYVLRHPLTNWPNYHITEFFKQLHSLLETTFPEHEFVFENKPEYENKGLGSIYSQLNFSIINPETEKYYVVSFFDNWRYHFMQHLGWKPDKMVKLFYAGALNYQDFFNWRFEQRHNADVLCPENIDDIYQPIFYNCYYPHEEDFYEKLYGSRQPTKKELIFRGWLWDLRKDMVSGVDSPEIKIIEKRDEGELLSYHQYLEELADYTCALSLPGGTAICNRDIECFAVGTPVIRPALHTVYADPLIPDYHYISCFDDCKYWSGNPSYINAKEFSTHLTKCWNRVKNNLDYLCFVSQNARKWYLRNCTMEKNLGFLISHIKLEDLNG